MTLLQRLINKLEYNHKTHCWLWVGRIRKGYGEIKYCGKHFGVHRVAYQYFVKDIPDGLCVLHKCDVPNCCNPMHLFLGTKRDNAKDRVKRNPYSWPSGNNHYSVRKLTKQDVLDIRASQESLQILAKRYNVHGSHISNIKNRKTWKYID